MAPPGKSLSNSTLTHTVLQSMLSESRGVVRVAIHVQPGAKRNAILGTHGDALKLAISAPPVDGKANEAVTAFVAEMLDVPSRCVTVVSGHTSRRKVIGITELTLVDASTRLARILASDG